MVRDNIKRMSRRTWCSTKRPKMLQRILDIYTWFHNQLVRNKAEMPRLFYSAKSTGGNNSEVRQLVSDKILTPPPQTPTNFALSPESW